MTETSRILYCHCAYANVVPQDVKEEVLRRLSDSGVAFDAVADLCEMAARKDPALVSFAGNESIRIAACYPRAVKWLFAGAGIPLDETRVSVQNMRTDSADDVLRALTGEATAGDEAGAL